MGCALLATAPAELTIIPRTHETLDIACPNSVDEAIAADHPDVIINAAAYTAVDLAESNRPLAYRINADGPRILATAARLNNIRMVHLSTDFVFDGASRQAYHRAATVRPLNVYGASKAAGEEAVRAILPDALILRTSWLYSSMGKNFALTMLGLMAEHDRLRVVSDQFGTPTHAKSLARALWLLLANGAKGTLHLTDAGEASWHEFAVAIRDEATSLGLLRKPALIEPISSAEFAAAAPRPAFSVLDSSDTWSSLHLSAPHWRQELNSMLVELTEIEI